MSVLCDQHPMAFLHGRPSFILRQYVSPITMPNWLQYTDNDCSSSEIYVMGYAAGLGNFSRSFRSFRTSSSGST